MPQEPKKRHSRARQGKRRAAIKLSVSKLVFCPNCKSSILPHIICGTCGYYKGREVISKIKSKKLKVENKESGTNRNEKDEKPS